VELTEQSHADAPLLVPLRGHVSCSAVAQRVDFLELASSRKYTSSYEHSRMRSCGDKGNHRVTTLVGDCEHRRERRVRQPRQMAWVSNRDVLNLQNAPARNIKVKCTSRVSSAVTIFSFKSLLAAASVASRNRACAQTRSLSHIRRLSGMRRPVML
jgi:hypothetical protein